MLNSRPLLLKNLEGGPNNTDTQILKRALTIAFLCLEATKVAAKNLVAWSITCKINLSSKSFRSIVTISWNSVAIDNPTTGLELGLQLILQI